MLEWPRWTGGGHQESSLGLKAELEMATELTGEYSGPNQCITPRSAHTKHQRHVGTWVTCFTNAYKHTFTNPGLFMRAVVVDEHLQKDKGRYVDFNPLLSKDIWHMTARHFMI